MTHNKLISNFPHRGFTLTELAIVLVIVALLVGGMLVSLSTSRDIANIKETQKQLASINEALLGFAAAQQRLPCPAVGGATGIESPAGGVCTNNFNGFVPAITLGITPTNEQGYAIDVWDNPIRYAVSNTNTNAFTKANGMKDNWSSGLTPDLAVCGSATGVNATSCNTAPQLTNNAVAVVFSTGKSGNTALSADETANTNNDGVFINQTQSPTFDDIVTWLSPNILYNRMISAGRLP